MADAGAGPVRAVADPASGGPAVTANPIHRRSRSRNTDPERRRQSLLPRPPPRLPPAIVRHDRRGASTLTPLHRSRARLPSRLARRKSDGKRIRTLGVADAIGTGCGVRWLSENSDGLHGAVTKLPPPPPTAASASPARRLGQTTRSRTPRLERRTAPKKAPPADVNCPAKEHDRQQDRGVPTPATTPRAARTFRWDPGRSTAPVQARPTATRTVALRFPRRHDVTCQRVGRLRMR